MVRQERAEIFALPFVDAPSRLLAPGFWLLAPILELLELLELLRITTTTS
jgi:hypothetical protein